MTEQMRVLFSQVAEHLAGRPVLAFFCEPPTKGIRGESYLEGSTPLVIVDIHPSQSWAERYEVLLHETAHAMKHFPRRIIEPLPIGRFAPASIVMTREEHEEHQADPRESEADQLAATWAAWAAKQAERYLQPGMSERLITEIRLIVLKSYKE